MPNGLCHFEMAHFERLAEFCQPFKMCQQLFSAKSYLQVAIIKTKSATIAFFSCPPFLLLALSFSPFLFLRYYDFGASWAQETCLLTPFHSNDCNFRQVCFQIIGQKYILQNTYMYISVFAASTQYFHLLAFTREEINSLRANLVFKSVDHKCTASLQSKCFFVSVW